MILLLLAVLSPVSATSNCLLGACYPPSGDLLLGRSQQLWASSTCGLSGSEVYCTPYQQRRMKCCPCDSRNPEGQLAHTIQDVASTKGPERWWQSQKGVSPVTIQADLKGLFQLDSLVLDFKGPRPQALVIEKTLDNGRTWQPYMYMATDCPSAFPGVPTKTPLKMDDIYCYTLPPTGHDPYKDHQINFRPLEQYMYVPLPKAQKIEDVSGLTGLRVTLAQLGEVPQTPGRSLSRFFALKEMRMIGRCMCHGHANKCLPTSGTNGFSNSVQVEARCDCQHNTAGQNCERCADLFNDLPWRAAEEDDPHACKRCECNNHAQRCVFSQALYEASGGRSGGMCVDCAHHTMGPRCDQCAPGYQPNPRSRIDQPDACIRCPCHVAGTVDGAACEDSGSCRCKPNVEGRLCDRCASGYFNLSSSNPQGCTKCSCTLEGSMSHQCDPLTGQCQCRLHFEGLKCERCSPGFWRPAWSDRCVPCDCDPSASLNSNCDQGTGQCLCKQGFGGRTCTQCANHMFGNPLRGCKPCDCDREGTVPEGCDKQTGACLCRPGVTGARCDQCGRDQCDSFPQCRRCPSCFFTLDAQIQNINLTLSKLQPPQGSGEPKDYGPRIHALESSLNSLKTSVPLPPDIVVNVDKALVSMSKLRTELDEVESECLPMGTKPSLDPDLDKIQDLLNSLNLERKTKEDNLKNSTGPTDTGPFNAIKKAHDDSEDAARAADATKDVLDKSEDVREKTEDQLNKLQPVNSRNLKDLNSSMATQPDLNPLAKMVCGKAQAEPCTPLQCGAEELCAPDKVPPCEPGKPCVGALPLGKKADEDAEDVQDKLDGLSKKISDAADKLQKTQETTDQVRKSAEKLSDSMKKARDALEEDLKQSRDVVKELKDFLSDPTSNLTHIQKVSDWVLKAKLPLSLADLKAKLEELKNLASGLPDSTAVLNKAQPQLEAAKKLLQEAQDARDTAKDGKADVDDLVQGLGSMEQSLSDLEDKLKDSTDLIDNLSDNITKAQEQLTPVEDALDDASVLLTPIKPLLDELKRLLDEGERQTEDAQDKADEAEEEAGATTEDMENLEKQLETLKNKAAATQPNVDEAQLKDRLAKLKKDAQDLTNSTETMFKMLDGKEDSIKQLKDEILAKSNKLEGLDTKLSDLLAQLRKRVRELQTCQG